MRRRDLGSGRWFRYVGTEIVFLSEDRVDVDTSGHGQTLVLVDRPYIDGRFERPLSAREVKDQLVEEVGPPDDMDDAGIRFSLIELD